MPKLTSSPKTSHPFTKSLLRSLLLSSMLATSFQLAPPAYATLDQTIAPVLDDSPVLVTVSLDPAHWSYLLSKLADMDKRSDKDPDKKPDIGLEQLVGLSGEASMPDEFETLVRFLSEDLKFDPVLDGLLNLGSHLSLGYRPYPGTEGDAFFSLNLRSGQRASELLQRLESEAAQKGRIKLVKQNFGGHDLYKITTPAEDQEVFRELTVTVTGDNLIGTIGSGDTLLKRMLYIDQLLAPESRFRIGNQPTFKPVRDSLKDKSAWIYVDTLQGLKLAGVGEPEELGELAFINEVLQLNRGVGLGVDVNAQGLSIKSMQVPDWAHLSPEQLAQIQAAQIKSPQALAPLLGHLPAKPVFFAAGQGLDVLLKPNALPGLPEEMVPVDASQVREGIKNLLNVDYEADLLPLLDGRYGLGLFGDGQPGSEPGAVMYLGVKKGQETAFDKLMQQQFRFRTKAFENMTSDDVSNKYSLYTLQTLVETNAVDAMGYYVQDAATLVKEAQANDYWKTLTNPVTGGEDLGQAIADYASFKGTADQAGMLFYEPVGEPDAGSEDGKRYAAYKIYAYDPDGTLYVMGNEVYSPQVLREDLPKASARPVPLDDPTDIKPKLLETVNGVPIYSMPLQPLLAEFAKEGSDPLSSSTKANAHTLQTIVETYGVDWAGMYPKDIATLQKEASAEGRDYWKDVTNPITGESGMNQSIADYSTFKGTVDQVGRVFYEPFGEPLKNEDGTFYTNYRLHAYCANGTLFSLSNKDDDKHEDRTDLPKAPTLTAQPANPIKRVDPVFARKDQVWMFASEPAALKAALGGTEPVRMQRWIDETGSDSADHLFFLDIQAVTSLVNHYESETGKKNKTYTALMSALEPWRSLFTAWRDIPRQGTETQMGFDVDMDKANPGAFIEVANAINADQEEATRRVKISSVKANMHTLQTMVETYAVDWEGVYAPDLATLKKEALIEGRAYWKDFTNPYAPDSVSVQDFKNYKPGPEFAGQVFYEPIVVDGAITTYNIYGADQDGQLILYKDQTFVLTNM